MIILTVVHKFCQYLLIIQWQSFVNKATSTSIIRNMRQDTSCSNHILTTNLGVWQKWLYKKPENSTMKKLAYLSS